MLEGLRRQHHPHAAYGRARYDFCFLKTQANSKIRESATCYRMKRSRLLKIVQPLLKIIDLRDLSYDPDATSANL